MKSINFSATSREFDLIAKIVNRAVKGENVKNPTCLMMDITACHCNGCPLELEALLKADDFDFAHDVFGIQRHMDRTTGELLDCFWPRFAKKEATL